MNATNQLDHASILSNLATNADRIHALARGISIENVRWKPASNSWSILEVVNHLYDEERRDFRARLDLILHHPGQPWPPINPPAWVIKNRYNERDPEQSLQAFLTERKASLDWLQSLASPDWNTTAQAPFGVIRADDILAAWAAHDLLHIRQLVELHYAWLAQQASPFSLQYAGEW